MSEAWAPTLLDVGSCIPTRTANVNLPGEDRYLGTFTSDTNPNATQAQDRIDKAVEDVKAACTLISTVLQPAAKNAAMWRAAADLELAYPDRNADANYYAQLDARARYEWDLFLKAAAQQDGTTASATPIYYMPDPPWWGDRNDI
jgi:hypothetical protein